MGKVPAGARAQVCPEQARPTRTDGGLRICPVRVRVRPASPCASASARLRQALPPVSSSLSSRGSGALGATASWEAPRHQQIHQYTNSPTMEAKRLS